MSHVIEKPIQIIAGQQYQLSDKKPTPIIQNFLTNQTEKPIQFSRRENPNSNQASIPWQKKKHQKKKNSSKDHNRYTTSQSPTPRKNISNINYQFYVLKNNKKKVLRSRCWISVTNKNNQTPTSVKSKKFSKTKQIPKWIIHHIQKKNLEIEEMK